MPIVIDQFDIQPAPSAAGSGGTDTRAGDAPAPTEQQLQWQLTRLQALRQERLARLRVY